MNRRDFLVLSGLGLAHPLRLDGERVGGKPRRQGIYDRLVAQNDVRVPELLARQERREGHRWFGGVPDRFGIHTAGGASGFVRDLTAAWAAPESRYHGSDELVAPMADAARYLLAAQHADGTIDLHTTNFHSPPDTAFVLEHVCGAAHVLAEHPRAETEELREQLARFIRRGAGALAVGGIHTPNHRWVVCMALSRAHALDPDERYVKRIDTWLSEQIDIDPDGQFTERSSSIYSPLTDRCLITVARLLSRPALLDPVRRNLEMTLYYVHADGEVATEASRRQDQYRRGSPAPYYYPYRAMAQRDDNGRFAAMARGIETAMPERLTGNLIHFLQEPALRGGMPPSAPLPTDFEKEFRHSKLVRIRRGTVSATIVADNPTVFSLHIGEAAVAVRLASAFFGKGQFVGAELARDGDAWVLEQELVGPSYQPLPPDLLPGDGDWAKMDRSARPQSEVQRLRSIVRITEDDGAFELSFEIAGTDSVPIAVELGFRPGGQLRGVTPLAERAWLLEEGTGHYELGEARIEFGPGRAEHRWTQLRGALPKLAADSVYLTGFTPWRAQLRLA